MSKKFEAQQLYKTIYRHMLIAGNTPANADRVAREWVKNKTGITIPKKETK